MKKSSRKFPSESIFNVGKFPPGGVITKQRIGRLEDEFSLEKLSRSTTGEEKLRTTFAKSRKMILVFKQRRCEAFAN